MDLPEINTIAALKSKLCWQSDLIIHTKYKNTQILNVGYVVSGKDS